MKTTLHYGVLLKLTCVGSLLFVLMWLSCSLLAPLAGQAVLIKDRPHNALGLSTVGYLYVSRNLLADLVSESSTKFVDNSQAVSHLAGEESWYVEVGFPFKCFWASGRRELIDSGTGVAFGQTRTELLFKVDRERESSGIFGVMLYANTHVVPLKPIWSGVLFNFIACLVLAAAMLGAYSGLKRLVYRRFGKCACGYSLAGIGMRACPECGEMRKGE